MADREIVIKALECRKNADKRCGNPCEETGMCHYATAVRDINGEIYRPFICDRERICTDALALLKEQEAQSVLSNRVCEVEPFRYVRKGFCPKCHQEMEWLFNRKHCGFCGQEVKWDG